jgi:hypothetical protein
VVAPRSLKLLWAGVAGLVLVCLAAAGLFLTQNLTVLL